MAIIKIGPNKWKVKASVWDNRKGYPVAKQATVTGTRAAAVIVESDLLKELRARSLTTTFASTFGDAADIYQRHLRAKGHVSTPHHKSIACLVAALGHARLEVFVDQFEAYRKHLICTPYRGKLRKGSTVNRYTAIARAVFNHLVNLELVEKNPITQMRFPNFEEKPRDRHLTAEERLRLLNAIQKHRPHILPIVTYLMAVPCRVGELITARREQYSPITGIIHILDSKAGIPIDKPVPSYMANYFKSIPESCPWLFYRVDSHGRYQPLINWWHTWRYCLSKAEIEDFRRHDLRALAATDMVMAGNTERDVMKFAGWKTNMLDVYYRKDGMLAAQRAVFCQPPTAAPFVNTAAG